MNLPREAEKAVAALGLSLACISCAVVVCLMSNIYAPDILSVFFLFPVFSLALVVYGSLSEPSSIRDTSYWKSILLTNWRYLFGMLAIVLIVGLFKELSDFVIGENVVDHGECQDIHIWSSLDRGPCGTEDLNDQRKNQARDLIDRFSVLIYLATPMLTYRKRPKAHTE